MEKDKQYVSHHSCPSTDWLAFYVPRRIIDILHVKNFDHLHQLQKKLIYFNIITSSSFLYFI